MFEELDVNDYCLKLSKSQSLGSWLLALGSWLLALGSRL